MKEKVENHSAKKSRLSKCLYNVLDLFCEIVRDLVRWFWRIVDFFLNTRMMFARVVGECCQPPSPRLRRSRCENVAKTNSNCQ